MFIRIPFEVFSNMAEYMDKTTLIAFSSTCNELSTLEARREAIACGYVHKHIKNIWLQPIGTIMPLLSKSGRTDPYHFMREHGYVEKLKESIIVHYNVYEYSSYPHSRDKEDYEDYSLEVFKDGTFIFLPGEYTGSIHGYINQPTKDEIQNLESHEHIPEEMYKLFWIATNGSQQNGTFMFEENIDYWYKEAHHFLQMEKMYQYFADAVLLLELF